MTSIQKIHAWDDHTLLMPWVLRTLPSPIREKLNQPVEVLCPEEEKRWLGELTKTLELQEKINLEPLFAAEYCGKKTPRLTIRDVLLSSAVQEPDLGIDQNLPDNLDLTNERIWMGGKNGPNSQGFRHMFFAGWNLEYPLRTFQLPPKRLGQAPSRTQIFAEAARTYFKKGEYFAGARLLAWSLHYVQDLAQPYHTTQIPNLRMIELKEAFQTLPRIGSAFQALIDGTSHVIGNYHYAYEQWVSLLLRSIVADRSGTNGNNVMNCLNELDLSIQADEEMIRALAPDAIALETSAKSRLISWEVSENSLLFFGPNLRDKAVNLPLGYGIPDYESLQKDPSKGVYRKKLETFSCESLERAIRSSRRLIEWTL